MLPLNNQRQIPQELTDQARKHIHDLLNMVAGVDFIMLCSSDGFELAVASKKNLVNSGKIAAVSSSTTSNGLCVYFRNPFGWM